MFDPEEAYMCKFDEFPRNVFVVKRLNSNNVTDVAISISKILFNLGVTVFVEASSISEMNIKGISFVLEWNKHINIDFIVEIGGDGTLLWVSQLFPEILPPIVGVSMGTLGYLNQFKCTEIEYILQKMYNSSFPISLRQRLRIEVFSKTDERLNQFTAVNECVIDRGTSPFLTILEVYYNDKFFTNVSADGLILATPSGSTAYSMSAGGPVVHPKVPCFLFTPICPHSLSFRPLIIPDTAELRIELSCQSNTSAWIAVDGRCRTEITMGMYIKVKLSEYPFPIVLNPSRRNELDSWLHSLTKLLYWNQRFEKSSYDANHNIDASNNQCVKQSKHPSLEIHPIGSFTNNHSLEKNFLNSINEISKNQYNISLNEKNSIKESTFSDLSSTSNSDIFFNSSEHNSNNSCHTLVTNGFVNNTINQNNKNNFLRKSNSSHQLLILQVSKKNQENNFFSDESELKHQKSTNI